MGEKKCPFCGCSFSSEDEINTVNRYVKKEETFVFNKNRNTLEMRYSDDTDYYTFRCGKCNCDVSQLFETSNIDYI